MMKARAAHFDNRRRPQRWSALLLLLAVLSLVMPPAHLCALTEATPGHSHSSSHLHDQPDAHSHSHADLHEAVSGHHDSHHHDGHHETAATHHQSEIATLSPVSEPHACCCDGSEADFFVIAPSRVSAGDESLPGLVFVPTLLPATEDIFALAGFHGRDGPTAHLRLHSQFLVSSLLGRAPPALV